MILGQLYAENPQYNAQRQQQYGQQPQPQQQQQQQSSFPDFSGKFIKKKYIYMYDICMYVYIF